MLARCRMVSICSPDSFAFFMADVARGHPDKLGTGRKVALVTGRGKAPSPHRPSGATLAAASFPQPGRGGKGLLANGMRSRAGRAEGGAPCTRGWPRLPGPGDSLG